MSTISFAGLASGFDSGTLITQLVTAEKLPEQAMQAHQSDLSTQISTLGTLTSQIQALGSAATAMGTTTQIQALGATSTDNTIVSAAASASAIPGTYRVKVTALAAAQTTVSKGFDTNTAGVAGTGSVTLTVGTSTATINFGATDTLDSIAAAINTKLGSVMSASVINDGKQYRLVINGSATGKVNAITIGQSGASLGLLDPGATVTPADDASFSVNGVAVTRASNTVSDVIGGVTLTLQGETALNGNATNVTVASDSSALQKKAQALVDAYNSIAQTLSGQLSYSGTSKPTSSLFGDSTTNGLQQVMSGLFASGYGYDATHSTSAGKMGITIQADGTLALDATTFSQALTADPTAMQHLLLGDGTKGSGLVGAIGSMVTQYTQYGTGILLTAQAAKTTLIKSYDDQIAGIESRATSLHDSLVKQYANLDSVMSALSQQQTYYTTLLNQKTTTG